MFKIRNLSEDIIKNEEEYKMLLQKSLLKATIDIEERDKRLMQKMKNEPLNKDFDKDIELNKKILNSLLKPDIKLDSIGMFVLSGRTPDEFLLN